MDGPTLAWFQWMMRNHQLTSWSSFLQEIKARFAHSPYKDLTGTLFKLTQRKSVSKYMLQCEAPANRIIGLPTQFLLSCFISGLDPDIHHEVQALQPLTLVQATGLTRLHEEKLMEHCCSFCGRAYPGTTSSSSSTFSPSLSPPTLPLSPSPTKLTSTKPPTHHFFR